MDDLDRLFHQVVRVLAARGESRLAEPVQVAELYQDLVPYRQYRGALDLDTYQDYEMAMLRLLAGERGYARVEPIEAQETLAAEAEAPYPDPGLIREFAGAQAYVDPGSAKRVLASDDAYAPAAMHPPPPPAESAGAAPARPEVGSRSPASLKIGEPCPYCEAALPADRAVYYCPLCGGNVRGVSCPECRTELEVGWIFCITCGRKIGRE